MPPLLSKKITSITTDIRSLSSFRSGKIVMVSKKKSKQTNFLIDSPLAHCVSLSSSPSPAASVSDVPEGLSTSSDESSSFFTPNEYIDVPGYLDICCGRGKGSFNRPGNKLFQDMVKENADSYRNAKSKSLKSAIVTSLVKKLTAQGARFVKKDPDAGGRWYVLSPSLAHEKTGHAIRDYWTQRQQQQRGAAADKHQEKPLIADKQEEKNVSSPPQGPRKKSSGKKRLHRKSPSTYKIQKPTAQRPIKSDGTGKRTKKATSMINGPPGEQVETMVVENLQVVLAVDSLPKLGMRSFHEVENHDSISTISSCPEDHDHLENFDLLDISTSLGEHQDAIQQNGNTDEGDSLSYVEPTSGNMWSQPDFLFADYANDSQSLTKQNIQAISSLVDDNKIDSTMIAHGLMSYSPSCSFPEHASQSGLAQIMSQDDTTIMDAYFKMWSQQQNLVHGFGSTNWVESNHFMPNSLVSRSPILQMGFTGNVMNP